MPSLGLAGWHGNCSQIDFDGQLFVGLVFSSFVVLWRPRSLLTLDGRNALRPVFELRMPVWNLGVRRVNAQLEWFSKDD